MIEWFIEREVVVETFRFRDGPTPREEHSRQRLGMFLHVQEVQQVKQVMICCVPREVVRNT